MKSSILLSLISLVVITSSANAAGAGGGDAFSSFVPLIVIFGIFYFLVIRPQQKRAKEHEAKVNSLKRDDKIITTGGIYGTIVAVREGVLEVKIADNVKVQVARSAVSDVIKDDAEKPVEVVTPTIVSK
jgi:preprotein translocase subunit YajC